MLYKTLGPTMAMVQQDPWRIFARDCRPLSAFEQWYGRLILARPNSGYCARGHFGARDTMPGVARPSTPPMNFAASTALSKSTPVSKPMRANM
jgi:hypothetical protein